MNEKKHPDESSVQHIQEEHVQKTKTGLKYIPDAYHMSEGQRKHLYQPKHKINYETNLLVWTLPQFLKAQQTPEENNQPQRNDLQFLQVYVDLTPPTHKSTGSKVGGETELKT